MTTRMTQAALKLVDAGHPGSQRVAILDEPRRLSLAYAEIPKPGDGEIRVKLHSKTQALETLARHLSMFKDNVDLKVSVSLADLVNGSYELERQRAAKTIEHQAQQISASDETPSPANENAD